MNERSILLIILALTMAILGGCQEYPESPKGVSQEFYDGLIDYLYHAEKVKGEIALEKRKEVEKYVEDNAVFPMEEDMGESMSELYAKLWFYYTQRDEEPNVSVVESYLYRTLTTLDLDVDIIDVDKILTNKN